MRYPSVTQDTILFPTFLLGPLLPTQPHGMPGVLLMRSGALGTCGGSLSCCLHYTVRWWMAAHGQPVSLCLLIWAPIQQEVRLRVPACSQTSPALGLGLNQGCAEETNTFSACSPFQMRKNSRVSRTGRGTFSALCKLFYESVFERVAVEDRLGCSVSLCSH